MDHPRSLLYWAYARLSFSYFFAFLKPSSAANSQALPADLAIVQTGDPIDLPVRVYARTFNDEITEDVIFSVASSQEGGIDIKVGSSTMHMPKHCSKVKDVIFSVASSQEGGIDIKAGSSTMHMLKHCSVHARGVQMVLFAIKHVSQDTFCCSHSMVPKAFLNLIKKASLSEGAPLNSSGYGEERRDSKMYALVTPQSRRAGDGGSSSTGTLVPPLWLDSGAAHHVVGDDRVLTNLRDPPAGMVVTVADGSQHPVTKVGDIQMPDIEITNVYLVPGLEMHLVSVGQLAKSKIVTIFYENHAELWLEGTQIGGVIIDDAESLYRLRFLQAP